MIRYFLAKKRTVRSPSAAKERSGRRMRPNHLWKCRVGIVSVRDKIGK